MISISISAIRNFFGFFFLFTIAAACRTSYIPTTLLHTTYQVDTIVGRDTNMAVFLQPFTDSVNKSMNDFIAVAATDLKKQQPEGTLGNVLADALLTISREKYSTHVDASLINFGGIRLNALPAGNVTRGKIFEIAPFDNIIVLQSVTGTVLQQLLNLVAAAGGWPCAGMSYQIKDRQAINIRINGELMKLNASYTLALTDYLANGGDHCEMLETIPQQNNGLLFREALIDYFVAQHKKGKTINAVLEKRVTYAE